MPRSVVSFDPYHALRAGFPGAQKLRFQSGIRKLLLLDPLDFPAPEVLGPHAHERPVPVHVDLGDPCFRKGRRRQSGPILGQCERRRGVGGGNRDILGTSGAAKLRAERRVMGNFLDGPLQIGIAVVKIAVLIVRNDERPPSLHALGVHFLHGP